MLTCFPIYYYYYTAITVEQIEKKMKSLFYSNNFIH